MVQNIHFFEEILEENIFEEEDDESMEGDQYSDVEPYQKTIGKLKEMQWIQCPVKKLNHIYNCLKFDLADEIDEFYSYCGEKMANHINRLSMKLSQTNLKQPLVNSEALFSNLNFNKKDRVIDIDNLQGICIFIVYSMRYSNIISDYFLVTDFVSNSV